MSKKIADSYLNINYSEEPLKDENKEEEFTTIDFSTKTIDQLSLELNDIINTNKPIFIWTKKRLNEKISLDNERLRLIYDKITILRDINIAYCNLKADQIFSEQYIKFLAASKFKEAEEEFLKARALHEQEMTVINVDTKIYKTLEEKNILEIEKSKAELERTKAETRKIIAEALRIETSNKQEEQKTRLIEKYVDTMDFSKLTEVYSIFFGIHILGADASQASEFEMREKTKEYLFEQVKAEASIKQAEADNVRADVDMKNIKNKEAKEQIRKKNAF